MSGHGRLEGRVALITGAARGTGPLMGFGGATARLFAREGALVVVADIDRAGIDATADQITGEGGIAVPVPLDVTDEAAWESAVHRTLQEFGRLDILVNCAGTTHVHRVDELPLSVFNAQIAVHSKGVFLGTKHSVPAMRKGGGGVIVNVSSMVSHIGAAFGPAYAAGKGATRIFTKATAIEHAGDNIRANSIHPGWCDTPLARQVMSDAVAEGTPDPRIAPDPRLARIPMARLGRSEEVAAAILFLASDDASYMTGAELIVDGGVTAQ